jgi:hypothetical protein
MKYIEDIYISISSALIHTIIFSTIIYLLYHYYLIPNCQNVVENIAVNYLDNFINNLENRINQNSILKGKIPRTFINKIFLNIIPKENQSDIDKKNNVDIKNAAQNKPIQNKVLLYLSGFGIAFVTYLIVYYLFLSNFINIYRASFEIFLGIIIMTGLFFVIEAVFIKYFITNYFNYNANEYIKKRIIYSDTKPPVSIYCYNQTDDFCKNTK